jgi:hypothetical protein
MDPHRSAGHVVIGFFYIFVCQGTSSPDIITLPNLVKQSFFDGKDTKKNITLFFVTQNYLREMCQPFCLQCKKKRSKRFYFQIYFLSLQPTIKKQNDANAI